MGDFFLTELAVVANYRGFYYCMHRVFVSPSFGGLCFVRGFFNSAWYWVVVDAGVNFRVYLTRCPCKMQDVRLFSVLTCFGSISSFLGYIREFPGFVDNILKVQGLPT